MSDSDDIALISDTARRLLAERHAFSAARHQGRGPAESLWPQFAELGWLGLAIPSEYGGFGGGLAEIAALAEEFGRALVLEPYMANAVLGAWLIATRGNAAQRAAWLPALMAGEVRIVPALGEGVTAIRQGAAWRLDGGARFVAGGATADWFLSESRCENQARILAVPRAAPGLTITPFDTLQGELAADLIFDGVTLGDDAVLGADDASSALEALATRAIIATGADALGAMQALLEMTVEHTRTRIQFGQALSKFQALQHRMAQMSILLEESRMALRYAMLRAEADRVTRNRASSTAKIKLGQAARFIGQQAIQLHGGIGMTEELAVGWYVKRLTMFEALWGNSDTHLLRMAALLRAPGIGGDDIFTTYADAAR